MSRRTSGRRPGGRKERGFALMAALFVLIILTALAAFAVRIGTTQQQSVAFDVLIARAQAAADSGIEFGANQALKHTQCLPSQVVVPTAAALNGFTVIVTCSNPSTHQIGASATPYHAYDLQSTAQHGAYGSPDYVARTVSRTVNDAP